MHTAMTVAGAQLANSFIVAFFKQQNKAPPSRQDWTLRQKGSLCHHHSAAAAASAAYTERAGHENPRHLGGN